MRSFIRHPSGIPLDIFPDHSPEGSPEVLINISHGGLSLRSQAGILPGTIVNIAVHVKKDEQRVRARVSWCRELIDGYDIGVEFLNATDAYTVRMVEQVCHIENYRRKVKEEQGRDIDSNQASLEWIAKNAGDFPKDD